MLKNGLFNISSNSKVNKSEDEKIEISTSKNSLNIGIDNLKKEGAKAAGKLQGDFTGFRMGVQQIFAAHVEQANKESGIKGNRDKKLNQKINELKSKIKIETDKKEETNQFQIPEKKKAIREKELRIEDIKTGEVVGEPVDKLGYYLSIGILIALTAYLVIFYTSVIYGAFIYSVDEALSQGVGAGGNFVFPTIVNLDAIPSVYQRNGVLGAVFLIVSTSMFIALGYLIHKFQEAKAYLKATGILLFTLLFDAILAYEIVEVIHEARYQGGLEAEQWAFSMVYTEVPFYIIIFAGFAVYVIWGLVLSYIFEEREKMQPGVRAIEKLKNEISLLKNDLKKLKEKAKKHREEINSLESEIESKRIDKEKEIFNRKEVGQQVGAFVEGWIGYIKMTFSEPECSQKIEKVKNHAENYLTKIEENRIPNTH